MERRDTFSYENKIFNDLLVEYSYWLASTWPEVLSSFNDPVGEVEFDRFEQETGLILPKEYKSLLSWRGGQKDHFEEPVDPFTLETLMSLQATKDNRECMNRLMEKGSLPEGHWDPYWLPFTADCFGNHTCIDLTPETYGEVLIFDHEIGGRIRLCENMTAWLAELMDKLNFAAEVLSESEYED
jgi:cell wall assembly regulator SMI1